MTTAAFNSLMKMTCTFERASLGASTSSSYGHQRISEATPDQTFTGVKCRIEPISVREQQMQATAGQVVGDYYLWVAYATLPTDLKTPEMILRYQVKNVIRTKDGETINAGPYDINNIEDEAGEGHHWKLTLRRVK